MAKMKKVFTLKVRLILLMLVIILPLTANTWYDKKLFLFLQ